MSQSEPAAFLNLDLELESGADLSALAEHFEKYGYVLYNGPCPNGYRLAVEPIVDGMLSPDVDVCTQHFINVALALPTPLRALWQACTVRVFDYGVDGGLESRPLSISVPAQDLSQLVTLGIDVRVTVYPYREAT